MGSAGLGAVGAQVCQKRGADGEALAAVAAAEGSLTRVHLPVPLQVGAHGEATPTLPAAERLLPGVHTAVPLQV